MKLYGIRNIETKKPLCISIFSNAGGDFCSSCGAIFEMSDYNDSFYIVRESDIAERALQSDPHWYNASLESPQWPTGFNPLDYEVFSIDLD